MQGGAFLKNEFPTCAAIGRIPTTGLHAENATEATHSGVLEKPRRYTAIGLTHKLEAFPEVFVTTACRDPRACARPSAAAHQAGGVTPGRGDASMS